MAVSDIAISKNDRAAGVPAIGWRSQSTIVCVTALVTALDLVWLAATPMDLDWGEAVPIFALPCIFAVISVVYLKFRPEPRLGATALILAQLFAFAVPGVTFSCLMTSLGRPMIDDSLAKWDAALGFDWPEYTRYVMAHPKLYLFLAALYMSPRYQIGFLVAWFGLTRRATQATRLVAVLIASAIVISVIGGLFPALGGYSHYRMAPPAISDFAGTITAFQAGRLHLISFQEVKGIITFPSYHTAMSIAIILASWPYRYLRYAMLAVNLPLMAGIPVIGAHYVSDMIAGAAIVFIIDQATRPMSRPAAQASLAN
jgi:hypothetical protein